jgi:hypothetical protein
LKLQTPCSLQIHLLSSQVSSPRFYYNQS